MNEDKKLIETVNGLTSVYGLIGNPVAHTLSPQIHNTIASMYGHNLVYVPFHVEKNLEAAVAGAYALNIAGINITVPYKNDVLSCCKEIDSLAAKIDSVNTLVRTNDGYKGYNTDMMGLYRSFCKEKITLNQEHIIMIGAGGAAKAVATLCAEYGVGKIYLVNRTVEKAVELKKHIQSHYPSCEIVTLGLNETSKIPEGKYTTIQCTSIGLTPEIDKAPIEDDSFYNKIKVGYDLIYKPWNTKFMQKTRQAGGRAVNGLGMLLYQGIIAYELWNHITIQEENIAFITQQIEDLYK